MLIGMGIALLMLLLAIAWPQVGLAIQLVGIMFAVIVVSSLGYESGILYATLVLMVLAGIVFMLRKGVSPFRFTLCEGLVFALLGLMILSLWYTSTPDYGLNKVERFIGICVPSMILARMFGSTREHMRRTLRVLSWISVLVLIQYILLFIFARDMLTRGGRFEGGSSSLVIGYGAAAAIVLVFYLVTNPEAYPWTRIAAILLILNGVIVMIATGSRGAFVGLLGGGFVSLIGRKAMLRSFLVIGLLGAMMIPALRYFAPDEARERIMTVFEASDALDRSGRTDLYMAGLEQYLHHPLLGLGTGSFADYIGTGDTMDYPHNLVVELAAEQGTIGLLLIGAIVVLCIKAVVRLRSKKEPLTAAAITLQWLFWLGVANAMSSFDMAEQRLLFTSIGFLAAVLQWPAPEEDSLPSADGYSSINQPPGGLLHAPVLEPLRAI